MFGRVTAAESPDELIRLESIVSDVRGVPRATNVKHWQPLSVIGLNNEAML